MDFKGKIILAPMAGIGDSVFRLLCRRHGADIVVSEMVSADGLYHSPRNTLPYLAFKPEERPVGIQLFGSEPESLARATAEVTRLANPDFIDLNSGCPVRKVIQKNGGAALLQDQHRFERIVTAMVKATHLPVTVKIRSGWTTGDWVDVTFARIAQECGAAALTLHPRSKAMGFSGHSFWERIAVVKKEITIPLIGNGDILSGANAVAMHGQTGCDSIMIGRGAYGNPWIFEQCRRAMDGLPPLPVSLRMKHALAVEHLDAACQAHGEEQAGREMKKHLAWYFKGFPGASTLRNTIFRASGTAELRDILQKYADMFESVMNQESPVQSVGEINQE